MASAAEQLASNINFSTFSRATELKKRIWFTLAALLVYRFGTYISIPGVNIDTLRQTFEHHASGMLGLVNMFAGGAVGRMAIFALGIMPYISASIIVQLLTSIVPSLESLKKEGELGRKIINQYTRYVTVILALVQAFGVAVALETGIGTGLQIVVEPGLMFRFSAVITLVGGTMFLMWLGEQITSRGVGNGISLIIFTGIVANFPSTFAQLLTAHSQADLSTFLLIGIIIIAVSVVGIIVFVERAQRRILIQYPKRQVGNQMFQGDVSHLPLKLNTAGVIPPIFASSLLLLPATINNFSDQMPEWIQSVSFSLSHGQPLYMIIYAALIAFFCFFYTAIVFNPNDTADQLKKHSGFIPGIRPGKRTAEYIDYVLTRITVIGAIYIILVCLLPEFMISALHVPFYLGGTSLLIVVNVTLDTVAQIQGHLVAHQYEGLIKKSKLRKGRMNR
ncbi:preprotein translocase, SecY subunit [Bartonella bacilliformis Peru38]|uniref:Protein translocase subunit SecY n=2 Tax=Bartonella bacilliformis TaxID=774 RepID=A1USR4_BARBK|nr:preprotein translocase subunit SecY [Bartonella bacilliformis]ABM45574.1 preprotein translocase, SecY subunit [Bartonella bacilliformis KC583]AMG85823.1 preprotein translocase subunit SecY [Bartonella bacilliformis]EKS44620.1 preprotein translocase subunit SecY [Bartonella bacilliformis INS]EYS89981.1 preprotein translocase, SecY subunit [Bartonella bacilliformis San Pedro600-02]EYS95324.1 preprotein translocase, SecY subunit [Bartonella bacilliformis Peru-18]